MNNHQPDLEDLQYATALESFGDEECQSRILDENMNVGFFFENGVGRTLPFTKGSPALSEITYS